MHPDSSHVDSDVITSPIDSEGNQQVSVVHTNVTESSSVSSSVSTGGTGPRGLQGEQGEQGETGATGPTGPGVPSGGSDDQVLRKASATNFDTEWHTPVKADVGLSNVDNTSDANKPISTAQQAALDNKQNLDGDLTAIAGLDSSTSGVIASEGAGWVKRTFAQLKTLLALVKADVGLGNVDNTSDANKPISTATQTALDAKLDDSQKGAASGLAELDGSGLVPTAQLPSYVDDVVTAADFASLPGTGETGKIYITLDTNITYRWNGSGYTEISASLALGETSSTAYRGDRGKTAYDHSQLTSGNPHSVTKSDVGLGNADNTSDANKPVSTAQQTALDLKANDNAVVHDTGDETIAGVKTFSSAPIGVLPTADAELATKEYVDDAVTAGGGYTDENAQDAVGGILADDGDVDFTYDDATPKITGAVKNDAITYAKMQNVSATDRLLGRDSAGAGDVEEIAPADARSLLGLGALATKSEVATADIQAGAVTYDKMQDISAAARILGRQAGGTGGDAEELTAAMVMAIMLNTLWPVGSIYINTSNTNPGTFLGGTWAAFGAGRVPVGFDSGQTEFDTDEETGGAKTHTLATSEIPSHSHTVDARTSKFGASVGTVWSKNTPDTSSTTDATGGGGAHNNLQPYIVVRMWKRTA